LTIAVAARHEKAVIRQDIKMVADRTVIVPESLSELMGILRLFLQCMNDSRAGVATSGAKYDVVQKPPHTLRSQHGTSAPGVNCERFQ